MHLALVSVYLLENPIKNLLKLITAINQFVNHENIFLENSNSIGTVDHFMESTMLQSTQNVLISTIEN